MMRNYISILFFIIGSVIYGQVGINTSKPSVESILDIQSPNRGILLPRLALTGTQNAAPLVSHETGLLLYNTTTSSDVTERYYYNDGTQWFGISNIQDVDITLEGQNNHVSQGVYSTIMGAYNTGIGQYNFRYGSAGTSNLAIGYFVMSRASVSGSHNIGFGIRTVHNVTSGSANIGFGNASGRASSGNNNLGMGLYALESNSTGNSNVALGSAALQRSQTGDSNIAMGSGASVKNLYGNNNISLGYITNGGVATSNNIALGSNANYENVSGENNVAVGNNAINRNNSSSHNIAFGLFANVYMRTGARSIAFGSSALNWNGTGEDNIFFGRNSGYYSYNGGENIAFGRDALRSADGFGNIALGQSSLTRSDGDNHIAIGFAALLTLSDTKTNKDVGNIAIGLNALRKLETGSYNTAVGYESLLDANIYARSNVSQNSALGATSFLTGVNTFNNSMALGYNARVTSSDQIVLGDNFVTEIGGQVDWTILSDKRLKYNIQENVPGIQFINKLRPVSYTIKKDASLNFRAMLEEEMAAEKSRTDTSVDSGFIAQEVEKVSKEIGFDFNGISAPKNVEDAYGLKYRSFAVPLVKTLQEQQEIIKKQQELIKAIKVRIEKLEKE